jgi:hypothetical protein
MLLSRWNYNPPKEKERKFFGAGIEACSNFPPVWIPRLQQKRKKKTWT